ncbi:RNA polymerase sigma factor [Pseudomonas sp. LRF_L74]|uniref:RNA polymerase sigma factor n=1 Tax=Pseudomonas sp. LRF_L74 TaxID=3369422 RepID=UPI003F628A57
MAKKVFEEMLAAYKDLRRELGNGNDSADVAQSSFERAMRYAETNTVGSARGLLFRMARNIRIDALRRERVLRFDSLDDDSGSGLEGMPVSLQSELSPERVLVGQQALEQVSAAIEALPPRCREAFNLSRVHGMSHEQVAQAMGISLSQVEKYMVRSLRACRDALDD